MRRFLSNPKFGCIVGSVLGLLVSLYLLLSKPSRIMDAKRFFDALFTACIPFILSGAISGYFVQILLIRKTVLSNGFFSKHKTGSIVGCLFLGIYSFYLFLSLGLLGGNLLGALPGELLDNQIISFLGRSIGVTVTSIILVLLFSFIGLFVGAFSDWSVRFMFRLAYGKST